MDVFRRQLDLVVHLFRPRSAELTGKAIPPQRLITQRPPRVGFVKPLRPSFCHVSPRKSRFAVSTLDTALLSLNPTRRRLLCRPPKKCIENPPAQLLPAGGNAPRMVRIRSCGEARGAHINIKPTGRSGTPRAGGEKEGGLLMARPAGAPGGPRRGG